MKFTLKFNLLVLCISLNVIVISATDPYQDPNLPIDERVADLISRMTLTEKIAQLGNNSPAISRLGIGSYNYWSEALHGVARSGLATSFPQAIALSSTWNPELIHDVASAISDEARVKNNTDGKGLTYWSPTVNMARDPRWGRAEENYGEDPYLAAQIAISFIKGMQGNDPKYLKTVATAKHFACNNVELNRYGISSDVDERSLREYYLPVFEAAVEEGGVYSIMSAYNAVNDVPCPANRTLLMNILRDEWNFSGYVVSDCDAIQNVWNPHYYVGSAGQATAISLINGNDLNCGSTVPNNALSAINAGLITEEDIDLALKRIFKARFLLGEFDPPALVPYTSIPDSMLDCQANRELALRAAREAIVLLKNENSILPLQKENIDTIAIIGPNANTVQLGGYSGSPSVLVTPVQGIADKLGVDISPGIIEAEDFSSQYGIQVEACSEGGSNVGYIENGDYMVYDNLNFGAGKSELDVRIASATDGGTLNVSIDSLNGTSLGSLTVPSTGDWQNWITINASIPLTSGIHNLYLKFSGASGYLYNINWFRFYNEEDEDPLGGSGRICYAKGCNIIGTIEQAELDKAIEFAEKADVAIVVCGTDLSVTDEGRDRTSLSLPGEQEQLIQSVYDANPNTVVVLVNAASLAVNWTQENVPAILTAWYDGQAQGTAIADVLFGDYDPGGKLTTTWYKSTTDLPEMSDYDIKNNRTYMYFLGPPLYPFGYGLSYTDFAYSNLVVSAGTLNPGDSISVSVDVENTGTVAGDEVVQLYVHAQSKLIRPKKELKGFKRITLQPAETKTVNFWLKHEDLRYYDETTRTFIVESEAVNIYVGSSSEDIRLQDQIFTTESTVAGTYRNDPFSAYQAEYLEGKSSGVTFRAITQGNLCVNLSGNNSYILVKNFDFSTRAKQLNASLASTDESSSIQVVTDQVGGHVAGTITIEPTMDLEIFTIQSCELDGIEGIKDIYLVLKGSSTANCRIDWFNFQEIVSAVDDSWISEDIGYRCDIFPNPVSSNFFVRYHLPEQSAVSIELFSIEGARIKTHKYNSTPGWHKIELNCTDEKLKSGMYIVKFGTDNYTESILIAVIDDIYN